MPKELKSTQPYGYHIVIEGHCEEQMRALFEEIQNKYRFFDNCVLDEINEEDTIIDTDRREETGYLKIKKLRKKNGKKL